MSSINYICDVHCSFLAILQRLDVVFSHLDDPLSSVVMPLPALPLHHVIEAVMLAQQFRSCEVKAVDTCDDVGRYRKESRVVEKLRADPSVP